MRSKVKDVCWPPLSISIFCPINPIYLIAAPRTSPWNLWGLQVRKCWTVRFSASLNEPSNSLHWFYCHQFCWYWIFLFSFNYAIIITGSISVCAYTAERHNPLSYCTYLPKAIYMYCFSFTYIYWKNDSINICMGNNCMAVYRYLIIFL